MPKNKIPETLFLNISNEIRENIVSSFIWYAYSFNFHTWIGFYVPSGLLWAQNLLYFRPVLCFHNIHKHMYAFRTDAKKMSKFDIFWKIFQTMLAGMPCFFCNSAKKKQCNTGCSRRIVLVDSLLPLARQWASLD